MKKVCPFSIQTFTSEMRGFFTELRNPTTFCVKCLSTCTTARPMFTVVNVCELKTYGETVNIDSIFTIKVKVEKKKKVIINTTMGRFTQNTFQRSPAPDYSEVKP